MEIFYLYGLIFMVLVVKSEYVIAPLDGEALLPCDSKVKEGGCHRVQWVKYATGVRSIILSWPKSLSFPDAERVNLRPDENGTHFISLTTLQESDEGLYSCEIWSGWNCIHVQNTTLKIKECKTLQAVQAVQGTTANLSCPLGETAATQRGATHVSWVRYWYRCNYKHEQVQRCYEINLQVKGQGQGLNLPSGTADYFRVEKEVNEEVEVEAQHSSRLVPAAVAAVLLAVAVAVAVALAGFLLHRRRNRRTAAPAAAWRPPTGAGLDIYTNCESMDCAVFKHISIYHEIPAHPDEH
uniref:Immunoglobulin domain-containing protein n=1 Tax=Tetraodon nigroviridis TaxID=99883 RepID=H3C4I9_TETNG